MESYDKVVENKVVRAVSARPRRESLRIAFVVNVRCLRTKNNLVSLFVEDSKPEILYVSEHWLKTDECRFYVEISELHLASVWCKQSRAHIP